MLPQSTGLLASASATSMYVCICNGVTERDIRDAAQAGCRSVPEMTMRTGAGANCGSCLDMVGSLLGEAHATRDLPLPVLQHAA